MVGVTVPIIPMAHQYLFTEPLDGVHPDLPQLRDPDNLVYFREEVGGLCMGGYERDPAPWGLDGIPADFNGRLLAPDMPRFESIMEGAIRRVPAMADARVSRVINGPEAFTPDNEFILGESEVRGFWLAAGFCAHGIAGAGGIGRQVASWIVDGEPELDLWKMDIRRFGAAYRSRRVHARAVDRELRDLLRHPLPERGAPGRPPAAHVADVRRPGRARCGLRREVRLGAPELVRAERRRSTVRRPRRVGTPPTERLGGTALVARHRRRGAGDPPGRGAVRRDVLRQARGRRAGRVLVPPADGGQRHRPTGGFDRLHAAARPSRRRPGRPDRHPPRRQSVHARDRHRVRQPRRGLAAGEAAERRLGRDPRHDLRACLLRAVGSGGSRHPRPTVPRRPVRRGLPVPHRARDRRRLGAGPGVARHLRRRARVGAVRADRVRPGVVVDAVGRRWGARDESPAATGRSTRCGSRRATASGRATSRPTRRRTRPASGSRSRSTRPSRRWPATRWSRPGRPVRASGCAASCSTTRSTCASATSRSGSRARSSAG